MQINGSEAAPGCHSSLIPLALWLCIANSVPSQVPTQCPLYPSSPSLALDHSFLFLLLSLTSLRSKLQLQILALFPLTSVLPFSLMFFSGQTEPFFAFCSFTLKFLFFSCLLWNHWEYTRERHCCCHFMTCCRAELYLHSKCCSAASENTYWSFVKAFCV